MAEYIEREALIAAYDKAHKGPPGGARKLMEEAPAVDVVPVVRCKDCKHLYQDTFDDSLWCCRDVDREVVENHFCSYGERRDSDG